MTADVVVLGSANLDLISTLPQIPAPGETVLSLSRAQRAGGKGLNQAVAAARGGASTLLLGAVGEDDAAELLLAEATQAGIDVTRVRRVAGPSGTAWIMVRSDGENAIVVDSGANAHVTDLSDAERDAIRDGRILVAQLETPLTAVAEGLAAARRAGVTTLLNAAPARDLPDDLLRLVDVLVVNEHEARQLAGTADPEAAATNLLALVGAVVVTLGAQGATLAGAAGRHTVPGVPARVVDTTGAGDTFTGVVAATLAVGEDLRSAVTRAVVAGALAVEAPGAVPSIPTRQAVDARLADLDRGRA